jgi:hypothetical protein
MDIALWHFASGASPSQLASALRCSVEDAGAIYAGIAAKRRVAEYLHAPAERLPA